MRNGVFLLASVDAYHIRLRQARLGCIILSFGRSNFLLGFSAVYFQW